jgi:putative multiple sugar transport system permease protein
MSFFKNAQKLLQQNIREYGMYIALAVIMVVFSITTKGLFLSSRNISNLINQNGYIMVLAVGMTLVIVARQIDLSVGFLAGFLGAIAATALKYWGWPVWLVIPFVLLLGILAGLLTGVLVSRMGIPSFVASLAGWLGYRGALQMATAGTGTIVIADRFFNAISNGFVPDILNVGGFLPGVHKLTLVLGLAAIVAFIFGQISDRKKKQAYHFEVVPMDMFVLQLVFVSLVIGAMTSTVSSPRRRCWVATSTPSAVTRRRRSFPASTSSG